MTNKVSKPDVPMSENVKKFHADWTAEDCIAELRRIAEIDPDRVVSRNYFRVHSRISESTWDRYFGTFAEFKRQAGIVLTRQQHGLERHIAKHASVSHYRAFNAEREVLADRYSRSTDRRFKTVVFCSDLHDKEIDPFYLRVLVDTVRRAQPDVVSMVGDVFDLPEFGRYTIDPREWDVTGRIQFTHEHIFKPLREAAPEAQIDLIEGNHEARLLRHLCDATPAMKVLLSDLHGWTIGKLLGLDEFQINYVAQADLAAFNERDLKKELSANYRIYFDTLLAHHFPEGRNMGLPGVNGHHHRHIVWSDFNPVYGAYEWHQLGSGHMRAASYCDGKKWHNGFAIAHLDTKTRAVNFDYVPVTNFAVVGGKWYDRTPEEQVVVERKLLKP